MAIELASSRHYKGPYIFRVFPIVGMIWLWAESWSNSVVIFWCDNQAVAVSYTHLTLPTKA